MKAPGAAAAAGVPKVPPVEPAPKLKAGAAGPPLGVAVFEEAPPVNPNTPAEPTGAAGLTPPNAG